MIWLLLGLVILLCLVSVRLFKKDFFAPAFVVCLAFAVSIILCLYNYERWRLWSYHPYTVFVIVSCLTIFIAVSFAVYKLCNKKHCLQNKLMATEKKTKYNKVVSVNIWIKIVLLLLFVGMIALSIYEVYRIKSVSGFEGSFFQSLENFRKLTSYSLSYETSLVFRVLQKVINGLCYVLVYIVIRNLFNKDKIRHNLVYVICIVLFVVQSFTISARAPILRIIAAAFFFVFIFANRRVNWKKNLFSKFLRVGAICFAVLLIGFFATKGLTGRGKNYDPVYYITIYAGGSIELLDLYLNNPAEKGDDIFGKETFYGVSSVLSRLSGSKVKYTKHLEYRGVGKNFVGNVYTPFRRYIADFGLAGCYLLVAVVSAFYSWLYYVVILAARRKDLNKDWILIIYSILVYVLFWYSIDDQFFTTVLSLNYVVTIVVALVGYFVLVQPILLLQRLKSIKRWLLQR